MSDKFTPKEYKTEEEAKEYIADYWNERSKDFTKLRKDELKSDKFNLWKKQIESHFNTEKKLKVLDVGCGSGFFSIMLSKMGHEVIGIDLTESMIELGRELAIDEEVDVKLEIMDAENLEFDNESFDLVISRNLTWNLPNPKRAYQEWLRVLKNGGHILNYDAEYAKNHHEDSKQYNSVNAHNDLSDSEVDKCHSIYHMLEISSQTRPAWDVKIFQDFGVSSCEIDFHVGKRIYLEKDKFHIPTPIFELKIKK